MTCLPRRYDMYAGDKLGSTQGHDQFEPPKSPTVESMPDTEGGQALELIEMANGETIWYVNSPRIKTQSKISRINLSQVHRQWTESG